MTTLNNTKRNGKRREKKYRIKGQRTLKTKSRNLNGGVSDEGPNRLTYDPKNKAKKGEEKQQFNASEHVKRGKNGK